MQKTSREVAGQALSGTDRLEIEGDLAAQMVEGINRFLQRQLEACAGRRERHWKRDFSSHHNYVASIEKNRQRFLKITGAVDARERVELQAWVDASRRSDGDACVGRGTGYQVFPVRWTVLKGVEGEGLLLQPEKSPHADIVALPDCDWTPEMLVGLVPGVSPKAQFARRLAENGCRVLVPFLLDRGDKFSGVPRLGMTNQPHREFIYRAAFALGRHIIGYELQKVLAVVDWFERENKKKRPVGVIGYGEGGLLALYAAAADSRIDAAAVCGYFQQREQVWQEPVYRNVFGLLEQFGDAELAGLVAPRALCIEACQHPEVEGPPLPSPGRQGAAPGVLRTPSMQEVETEFERARQLLASLEPAPHLKLVKNPSGPPGSEALLREFMGGLGIGRRLAPVGPKPRSRLKAFEPDARLQRQVAQLLEHTQLTLAEAEFCRRAFWIRDAGRREEASRGIASRDEYMHRVGPGGDPRNVVAWQRYSRWYRRYLWDEVIGRLPRPRRAARPRTRQVCDEPGYRGYEVVLDVYPEVFAYGMLLVPRSMRKNEQRPLVVCQHGLEGRPQDVADPRIENPSYNQYGCRLAERGFVVYAPQNPYIGGEAFRTVQRLAHPLKKTLFSFIVAQHQRTLEWLAALHFVDPERMAFYGLSYGGVTAMRVPALLEQYCLSICSANYNEWIWKLSSIRHPYSYPLTGEYEMPEFDVGNTFNYAEMSWLICPRPFMVERGHHDGVAPDEWVAYEFARTRRHYVLLGLGERTEIEWFEGQHAIHGEATFRFLERHLGWPE